MKQREIRRTNLFTARHPPHRTGVMPGSRGPVVEAALAAIRVCTGTARTESTTSAGGARCRGTGIKLPCPRTCTMGARVAVGFARRMNLSFNNSAADGRASGSFCRHRLTNACGTVQGNEARRVSECLATVRRRPCVCAHLELLGEVALELRRRASGDQKQHTHGVDAAADRVCTDTHVLGAACGAAAGLRHNNARRVRRLACRQLDGSDAKAPYVSAAVIPALLDYLRRHPERRAHKRVAAHRNKHTSSR